MTQVGYFDSMPNAAALGGSIGCTTTSYLPRTAAAAMRIQDGRTPLCACPVHRRMPMQKAWSISSKPLMSPAPQPAAQDGDGLSSSTHQWCIRKKVATFLCNMSTKPARAPAEIGAAPAPCRRNRPVLYPAEMGVPRHRAAASGAGCDLRSQGLARGYGDQQRLCRQLLGWPWVMGLRAGYFHTDVGK